MRVKHQVVQLLALVQLLNPECTYQVITTLKPHLIISVLEKQFREKQLCKYQKYN
jgi:hypothetical protein